MAPLGFFDPLSFSKVGDEAGFRNLRAAEIKHGRVAMMAAVGAVAQHFIKFPGFEKVPSGLGAVTTAPGAYGFVALFVLSGVMELGVWTEDPKKEVGNFGDPVGLGMYDDEMRNRELNNGRMAMFAALGIVAAEFLTGKDGMQQLGLGALGRARTTKEAGVLAAGLLSLRGAARKVESRRVPVARSAMFQQASRTPPRPVAIPALPEPGYRKFEDPILDQADAGFDPLNLGTSEALFWGKDAETQYYNYREAELKHGRLAMLAAMGWLSSEQLQAGLAQSLDLPDKLVGGEIAPSLVNGGLGGIPSWFLPAVVLVTAWIESIPRQRGLRSDALTYKPGRGRVPGDFGFDPLGLQEVAAGFGRDVKWLHNAEVKNGRLAMVAITAFVAQEFVSRGSVLDETQFVAESLFVDVQAALS